MGCGTGQPCWGLPYACLEPPCLSLFATKRVLISFISLNLALLNAAGNLPPDGRSFPSFALKPSLYLVLSDRSSYERHMKVVYQLQVI
jgi:hypothetical protein